MGILRNNYPHIQIADATVLITGAGRGIGFETAKLFAAKGARVIITDIDGALAASSAKEIGATGRSHDVRDRHSWDGLIAEFPHIDILVNNAGVMPLGGFLDERDQISAATMDINVWGLILGMRTVVPGMVSRGRGHVVNIASLAGIFPMSGMAVYNASKFAAVGLSAATRVEFAPSGVSVSAILPSAVRTTLTSGVQLGQGLPTVDPEDVAEAIVGTVTTRRAETAVPGYMIATGPFLALSAEPVVKLMRRVLGERRRIDQIDSAARASYNSRVASIAKEDAAIVKEDAI